MSRGSKAWRQSPRLLFVERERVAQNAARQRVTATVKRYARLDEHGEPIRCVGFRQGSKIVFDTFERAEACRRSLTSRGLSQTRSVHECRRREGETHYHLTRREPAIERE